VALDAVLDQQRTDLLLEELDPLRGGFRGLRRSPTEDEKREDAKSVRKK